MDREIDYVDQLFLQQSLCKETMAEHEKVSPVLLLELPDGVTVSRA
jgi:hypothetical protein